MSCDPCDLCCVLVNVPGEYLFEGGYQCPRLYWSCACPGGVLTMQTKIGGVWSDIADWEETAPNSWYPTPEQVSESDGFRLKCTIDSFSYYSNEVEAFIDDLSGECFRSDGSVQALTVTIDYTYTVLNSGGATIIGPTSGTVVVPFGTAATVFNASIELMEGNLPSPPVGTPPANDDPAFKQMCLVISIPSGLTPAGVTINGVSGGPMPFKCWNIKLPQARCSTDCDGGSIETIFCTADWDEIVSVVGSLFYFDYRFSGDTNRYFFTPDSFTWSWL